MYVKGEDLWAHIGRSSKKNQQIGQNLQNEKLMLFQSNVGFQDQVTSYSFESKNL